MEEEERGEWGEERTRKKNDSLLRLQEEEDVNNHEHVFRSPTPQSPHVILNAMTTNDEEETFSTPPSLSPPPSEDDDSPPSSSSSVKDKPKKISKLQSIIKTFSPTSSLDHEDRQEQEEEENEKAVQKSSLLVRRPIIAQRRSPPRRTGEDEGRRRISTTSVLISSNTLAEDACAAVDGVVLLVSPVAAAAAARNSTGKHVCFKPGVVILGEEEEEENEKGVPTSLILLPCVIDNHPPPPPRVEDKPVAKVQEPMNCDERRSPSSTISSTASSTPSGSPDASTAARKSSSKISSSSNNAATKVVKLVVCKACSRGKSAAVSQVVPSNSTLSLSESSSSGGSSFSSPRETAAAAIQTSAPPVTCRCKRLLRLELHDRQASKESLQGLENIRQASKQASSGGELKLSEIRANALKLRVNLEETVHAVARSVLRIADANSKVFAKRGSVRPEHIPQYDPVMDHSRLSIFHAPEHAFTKTLPDYLWSIVQDLNGLKEPIMLDDFGSPTNPTSKSMAKNLKNQQKSSAGTSGGDDSAMGRGIRCLLLGLAYVDRLIIKVPAFRVTNRNVHRLMLTAVLMALKYTDDIPVSLISMAEAGEVDADLLNEMEEALCTSLAFDYFAAKTEYKEVLLESLAMAVRAAATFKWKERNEARATISEMLDNRQAAAAAQAVALKDCNSNLGLGGSTPLLGLLHHQQEDVRVRHQLPGLVKGKAPPMRIVERYPVLPNSV